MIHNILIQYNVFLIYFVLSCIIVYNKLLTESIVFIKRFNQKNVHDEIQEEQIDTPTPERPIGMVFLSHQIRKQIKK